MATDGFGTLHLPATPAEIAGMEPSWSDCTVNVIVTLVAVILFVINLKDYLRQLPALSGCLFRARPNVSLEHSIHSSTERSLTALTLSLPFLLMVDRFGLYRPSFIDTLEPQWTIASRAAVLAAFVIIRWLISLLRPSKLNGDESAAAVNVLFTSFIPLVTVMLVSLGTMLIFKVPDDSIRIVLLAETAAFYLAFLLVSGRIMALRCSALQTFLYLCALDIIPAALIVASGMML